MRKRRLLILAGLLAAAPQAFAQGPGAGLPGPGLARVLGLEGMLGGKIVQGAPFSAQATIDTAQTLVDGTHINRTITTMVYRDSQGRVRHEVTLSGFGPVQVSGQPARFVVISDPVAGVVYVLNPERKTVRRMPLPPDRGAPGGNRGSVWPQKPAGEASAQTESLGTQTISGVKAEGTRVTRTIPAGQIGNDKPVVVAVERWYSPDLQVLVKSTRKDPRFGETTFTLANIQRQEPDAALFQVPVDYTLRQGGRGAMRMRQEKMQPPPAAPNAPAGSAAPSEPPAPPSE